MVGNSQVVGERDFMTAKCDLGNGHKNVQPIKPKWLPYSLIVSSLPSCHRVTDSRRRELTTE